MVAEFLEMILCPNFSPPQVFPHDYPDFAIGLVQDLKNFSYFCPPSISEEPFHSLNNLFPVKGERGSCGSLWPDGNLC